LGRYGLPREPTAMMSLQSGADIITFSGDKLLGGPQCGIIAGRADLINQIRKNPIKRALRIDKMTLAALTEVLKLYRHPDKLSSDLPTLKYLTRDQDDIKFQAGRISPKLSAALPATYNVKAVVCASQIGSGAMPIKSLPSFGIQVTADNDKLLRRLAEAMRELPYPVIGRISGGIFQLDLRCLDCESLFLDQLSDLKDLLN
jgi:L-seryl-tRNA(Ser) seleniumtransferase